jgi:hypothetical protein
MNCKTLETSLVCYNNGTTNETLVAHYEYGKNATGNTILVAVRYTDASGTVIDTTGGTVTAGQCMIIAPDIEFEKLCDVNTTTGIVTEFLRRSVTTFNSIGTPTLTVTDWQLDKITPYVITGTVGACNQDCDPVTSLGVLTTWG